MKSGEANNKECSLNYLHIVLIRQQMQFFSNKSGSKLTTISINKDENTCHSRKCIDVSEFCGIVL